jgi:hypothetical protein
MRPLQSAQIRLHPERSSPIPVLSTRCTPEMARNAGTTVAEIARETSLRHIGRDFIIGDLVDRIAHDFGSRQGRGGMPARARSIAPFTARKSPLGSVPERNRVPGIWVTTQIVGKRESVVLDGNFSSA